jgi:hypothetical protein
MGCAKTTEMYLNENVSYNLVGRNRRWKVYDGNLQQLYLPKPSAI